MLFIGQIAKIFIFQYFVFLSIALCAESEVRKAVERSSYAVALKFRVFFLLLKSVKF